MLQALEIIPIGKMSVCNQSCAQQANASTKKTTNKVTTYGARKNGITYYLRCDNMGKHMFDLRKICEGEYGIQLDKDTALPTPLQNGIVVFT